MLKQWLRQRFLSETMWLNDGMRPKNPGMGFTNAIVYQNALHIRLNNYVYKWDDPKCKMYGWVYALHRRAPKAQNDKVTDFKTYYLVLYTAEKKMKEKKASKINKTTRLTIMLSVQYWTSILNGIAFAMELALLLVGWWMK